MQDMNRRELLKGTVAAIAAVMLGSKAAGTEAKPMQAPRADKAEWVAVSWYKVGDYYIPAYQWK